MSRRSSASARPHRGRRLKLAACSFAALTAGTLVIAPSSPAGAVIAPARNYVALGDSFTSGPLVGNQLLSGLGCFRSDIDYPKLTAKALGTTVIDVSCSGATSKHVTTAQTVVGLPVRPQVGAVTADTTAVSMGFGGNDIGFVDIITGCASVVPWGSPCKNKYAPGGKDSLALRIDSAGPLITQAIGAVKAKAPGATIYVVGYPALLPESGSCWPQMPYTASDVAYLRDTNKRLNAMLASRAVMAGAIYVDTYTPTIGHDSCKNRTTRWIEPIVPGNPAAPVHPNAAGHVAMAAAVTATMRANH